MVEGGSEAGRRVAGRVVEGDFWIVKSSSILKKKKNILEANLSSWSKQVPTSSST